MDQNFRKRLQKTLYSGELEPEHNPLALTDLAVEYFQDLAPHKLGHVDLHSASTLTSQDTVSPTSVAMSMMYAKRLQRKRPDYIKKVSSSDLFIISMMMASKYLYDEGVDEEVFNDEWAENAGLEKEEVNKMELDFLDAMDWELFIGKDDFDQAMSSVERSIALKEGLKRGWFSYTDLHLLLDDPMMQLSMSDVGLEWLKVVMVSSAAYFAGIMTMVGSTVLVTNSLALASSGALPVLLPGLHLAPATLPGLAPSPSLSPLSMLEFPSETSLPSRAGFRGNETGDAMEIAGEKESEPVSGNGNLDPSWMQGKSVVDTILSQLMAVLTLKSHLVQFVSAVSDSCRSVGNGKHLAKKAQHFRAGGWVRSAEKTKLKDEEKRSPADAVISRWFEMEESSVEVDGAVGSCPCCRKRKVLPGNGCEMDSGFMPSGSSLQQCHGSRCWEEAMAQRKLGGSGWWKGHGVRQCQVECQGYSCGAEAHPGGRCSREASASMQRLFPDIVIGFSTSMPPPVYAT